MRACKNWLVSIIGLLGCGFDVIPAPLGMRGIPLLVGYRKSCGLQRYWKVCIALVSTEYLSLVRLSSQWEQCCGSQVLFGNVQRWLLWMVDFVLHRVWWSFGRKEYLNLCSLRSAYIGWEILRVMPSVPTLLQRMWEMLMQWSKWKMEWFIIYFLWKIQIT